MKPEGKSPAESELAAGPGFRMAKRVGIYHRISKKDGQTVENQRPTFGEAIDRRASGSDERISGANGRDKCPALDRLLKAVGSDFCTTPGSDVGSPPNRTDPTGIANGR